MFADFHHFTLLAPALPAAVNGVGSVSTVSTVYGTTAGEADIYFGAAHLNADNVAENWISDDQVSNMAAGVNGPVTRNEGMYNAYTSVKAFWSDTINMDNLRGGDATGLATPGAQEVTSEADGVSGAGNTVHTYSGDSFY
jgi:hypothetical protein